MPMLFIQLLTLTGFYPHQGFLMEETFEILPKSLLPKESLWEK